MEHQMHFTEAALKKIAQLMKEENLPEITALRVFVQGGGCSGFQYGFTFEEHPSDDDFRLSFPVVIQDQPSSVPIVIDSVSFQYLQNANIDYQENLEGAQFVVNNPNAQSTCGCGSSFSA